MMVAPTPCDHPGLPHSWGCPSVVAMQETIAKHAIKRRVHVDRYGFARAKCICGWCGSPWEGLNLLGVEESPGYEARPMLNGGWSFSNVEAAKYEHAGHVAQEIAEALVGELS